MGHSLFNGKELQKGFLFHVEIQVIPSEALVFNFKEERKIFLSWGWTVSVFYCTVKKKKFVTADLNYTKEDMCLLPAYVYPNIP